MGEVDAVLRELHSGGFSILASEIGGLRPQKNEPTPGVLELQQRYARVPSSPMTAAFSGPLLIHAPLPTGTAQVLMTFDIVQAPSAFSLPVMQKRAWDPPFQVRMTWRSSLPLQFMATVAAFVADEEAVQTMLTWQPPSQGDAAKHLMDHQQERMVALAHAPGGGTLEEQAAMLAAGVAPGQCHYADAVFTFNRLQFGAPSQMRPRWLVFAASLLGGGCVYSHYKVPTVVMSRLAEQFDKAKAVLWGSQEPPSCDSSVMKMDYRQLRKYIKRELVAIGIQREPTEEDYKYLAARAGFVTTATGARAGSTSLAELTAFKQWFGGHLVMLKYIRPHYERSEPQLQVVCGFGITREQAEAMLAPHPVGTFLLRFGSQGGQLVLSVRSSSGSASSPAAVPAAALQAASPASTAGGTAGGTASSLVVHYAITTVALQHSGLEAVLERNGTADQLLDTVTGQRHFRSAVLDRSYVQAVDMAAARKRLRAPERRRDDEEESSAGTTPPPEAPLTASLGGGSLQRPATCATATPALQPAASGPLHTIPSLESIPSVERTPAAMPEVARMDSLSASAGSQLRPVASVPQQQQQQAQPQPKQSQSHHARSLLLGGPAASTEAGQGPGSPAEAAFRSQMLASATALNPFRSGPGMPLQRPSPPPPCPPYPAVSLHGWGTQAASAYTPRGLAAQQQEHAQQVQAAAALAWSGPGLLPLVASTVGSAADLQQQQQQQQQGLLAALGSAMGCAQGSGELAVGGGTQARQPANPCTSHHSGSTTASEASATPTPSAGGPVGPCDDRPSHQFGQQQGNGNGDTGGSVAMDCSGGGGQPAGPGLAAFAGLPGLPIPSNSWQGAVKPASSLALGSSLALTSLASKQQQEQQAWMQAYLSGGALPQPTTAGDPMLPAYLQGLQLGAGPLGGMGCQPMAAPGGSLSASLHHQSSGTEQAMGGSAGCSSECQRVLGAQIRAEDYLGLSWGEAADRG